MPSNMDTWARRISAYENIPEKFKNNFPEYTGLFPYTVYSPSDIISNVKINERLSCLLDDRLHVLENNHGKIIEKHYLLEDINIIEHGQILLYSWIKVRGIFGEIIIFSVVEFNTVVEELFLQIINTLRKKISAINSPKETGIEADKFNFLAKTDYKFMNFGKDCIMPGQHIIRMIYQPAILKKMFGLFSKDVALACLLILTDDVLIKIREQEVPKGMKAKYGIESIFISLGKIQKMLVEENEKNNFLKSTIWLPQDDKVFLFIDNSNRDKFMEARKIILKL